MVLFKKSGFGSLLAADCSGKFLQAAFCEVFVELLQIPDLRDRHHVVAARIAHHRLHDTLFVRTSHQAEMVIEQIMAYQLKESIGEFSLPRTQNAGHQCCIVIVRNPTRYTAEE